MIDGDKEIEIRKYLVEGLGYPDDFAREYLMEMRYNQMHPRKAFRKTARSSWISEESREWAFAQPEMEELLSELSDEELIKRINAFTQAAEKGPFFRGTIARLTTELDRRTQP